MLKSKISERVQEVILPDFPDDDNTVPTVTKSRRVSFGTNFVKEFIVGSAVSGQCMPEYEQAFPSSDSSTADSGADSGLLEHSMFAAHESHKIHKSVPPVGQPVEAEFVESRPKLPKFSSTVCFSADSPTADMEFTEGCITLAKSILDKKNKEMTVIIQAKPKEPKDDEKGKEEETKYFEGSQFEMSMTRCLKSKGNKREEKRFESEKTKIFSKYENEMSITRCSRMFNEDDSDGSDGSWEECKENRMPLDMIMRHLDKDNSDLENDLFNPQKTFGNFFSGDQLDLTNESEKLNLNESMDISTDFQSKGTRSFSQSAVSENQIRKSAQLSCHESGEEVQMPEKSLVGESTDDKIDKSTDEMSLDEAQPFERAQSLLDSQSADCKVNKSIEQKDFLESEVLTLETEQEIVRTVGDISAQQMSLDVCGEPSLPEKEPSLVEPNKISESVESNESEEVLTCEREPSLSDLPSTEKISKLTEQRPVELPSIVAELEQSEGMSLEVSHQVLTPEKKMIAEQPSLAVNETSKSPEQMSLDGSYDDLPSLSSPTDPRTGNKVDNSTLRANFDGTEEIQAGERELTPTDLPSTDRISESIEPAPVELPLAQNSPERKSLDGVVEMLATETQPSQPDPALFDKEQSAGRESLNEAESLSTSEREPYLVDVKVIESLKEQSKEPGCVWSLNDLHHPQPKTQGWLSFKCNLLDSSTAINFALKMSNEDSLVACSIVTNSEISLDEEKQFKLPEYRLVLDFGFNELKKYFKECRIKVETIRQVPYFLDQVNSFMMKMNAYLRQIYSILTMYPGSRLNGSRLSFRLYSFPVFFSCVLSIDLSNLFRLSKSSLSLEIDFGSLDENRIREIFQDCLKCDNTLCEFVVQSTKYIIDLEKESGCVSKRGHIRLLPAELKL